MHSNWAGNYIYRAAELARPRSVPEIQSLVRSFGRVKALGSRHCFNDIADTDKTQISTERLERVFEIDAESSTLTISAGLRYGDICEELDASGYALRNLASLPHISIAGACATATHGSGVANQSLAAAVSRIELVDGSGTLVTLDQTKDADVFRGAVVNLGALGIVTKIALDIEPSYWISQNVFTDVSLDDMYEKFAELMSAAYSVSFFTNWRRSAIGQVWVKHRSDRPDAALPAIDLPNAATRNLHPIAGSDAANCTEQMGNCGKWFERLPHFRMGFTPSSGEELQSEYFVSREHAVEALKELEQIRESIAPLLLTCEIRTIAADDLWLSPAYKRDSVAFHFTWQPNTEAVLPVLSTIEQQLGKFDPRPHWGKLFTMSANQLALTYERLEDFRTLRRRFDPAGKFDNQYLQRVLGIR